MSDPLKAIDAFREAIESEYMCERCGMTIAETKVQGVMQLPHKWAHRDHVGEQRLGTCDPWLKQLERRLDEYEARMAALDERLDAFEGRNSC